MFIYKRLDTCFAELCKDCVDCVKKFRLTFGYADRVGVDRRFIRFAFAAFIVEGSASVICFTLDELLCRELVDDEHVGVAKTYVCNRRSERVKANFLCVRVVNRTAFVQFVA